MGFRFCSIISIFLFLLSQFGPFPSLALASAQQAHFSETSQTAIPVIRPSEMNVSVEEGFLSEESSLEFLGQAVTLTLVEEIPYEVNRYTFEEGIEQLSEDYATAIVLESISEENIAELLNLNYEVGLIVLAGELVLFSTGQETEIGILHPARELLSQAGFISHTHVNEFSQEGPSDYDLFQAVDAPKTEFVLTGEGVFSYNSEGALAEISKEDYLAELNAVKTDGENLVEARSILNSFIEEMDRYNEAVEDEKEVFRRASTPLLDSFTVTINNGATHTNNPDIALNINTSEIIPGGTALEMAFSEDGVTFTSFEAYQQNKNFTFTGNDGNKSVFIKLKDQDSNERVLEVSIFLDRTPPQFETEYFMQEPMFGSGSSLQFDFGQSIAFLGENIVVGDPRYGNQNGVSSRGNVELRNSNGTAYLTGSIQNPDPSMYDFFGYEILTRGNENIFIGAYGDGADAAGAVFVYDVAEDSQSPGQLLMTFENPDQIVGDDFGRTMVIENDLLFIGAPSVEGGNLKTRHVYVFDLDSESPTYGEHVLTLSTPAGLELQRFGMSIAVQGNLIAIGSPNVNGADGTVNFYNGNRNSSEFGKLLKTVSAPLQAAGFGQALTFHQDKLYVGAPGMFFNNNDIDSGGKVFELNADTASQDFGNILSEITASTDVGRDYFGYDLTVANDRLIIGAHGDEPRDIKGKVVIIDIDQNSYQYKEILQEISDDTKNFGKSLFAEDNKLIISTPQSSSKVNRTYLFRYEYREKIENFLINNGAEYTNSLEALVSLGFIDNISAQNNLSVAFSTDGINFSEDEPYLIEKNIVLPNGPDGERRVYVRLTDEAGNTSIYNTSIIIDRVAPLPVDGVAPIVIEDGAEATRDFFFDLDLSIEDDRSESSEIEMAFSKDGINYGAFEPFASTDSILFSGDPNGNKTVYVKFRDGAGNVSNVFSDEIIYDRSHFPTLDFTINGGAATTNALTVNIDIAAEDAVSGLKYVRYKMRAEGRNATAWTDYIPYTENLTIELDPLLGKHDITINVYDKALNTKSLTKSIILDGITSVGPIEYVKNGLFELELDQTFDAFLNKIFSGNNTKGFTKDVLGIVELLSLGHYAEQFLADTYDFIISLPTVKAIQEHLDNFANELLGSVLGLGSPLEADIQGIGLEQDDKGLQKINDKFSPVLAENFSKFLAAVKQSGIQQSRAFVDVQNVLKEFNSEAYVDRVVLEEIAHRWLTFLSSGKTSSKNPLGILGRGNGHWSAFFDAGLSPMDGIDWQDNGNGTFTMKSFFGTDIDDLIDVALGSSKTLTFENIFNDFDLYAMGLMDKDDVTPSFVIDNPRIGGTKLTNDNFIEKLFGNASFIFGNHTITGKRRTIHIEDIIAIEGERNPASENAQKDFNAALVLVHTGSPNSAISNYFQRIGNELDDVWDKATRGLSAMRVGATAQQLQDFIERVLQKFDDLNNADPSAVSTLETAITETQNNESLLTNLESLLGPVWNLLGPLLNQFSGSVGFAGPLGAMIDGIQDIYDHVTDARDTFNSSLPEALNILPAAQNLADIAENGRDQLEEKLQPTLVTGLLPEGFGAFADGLIAALQSPVQTLITPLINALTGTNNHLANHAAYTETLNNAQSFLDDSFPVAQSFDQDQLSSFPSFPEMQFMGMNQHEGQKNGKLHLISHQNSALTFGYDVGMSPTAYTKFEADFKNGPHNFTDPVLIGMSGPEGAIAKVLAEDENGKEVEFFIQLSGKMKNFTLDFSGSHVPDDFDAANVSKICILLDQGLVGAKNKKGTFVLKTGIVQFAPSLGGINPIYKSTKAGTDGSMSEFTKDIFDATGKLLYTIVRKGIRRDKKTGEITGYSETLLYPDKSRFTGRFYKGIYKLTGSLNLPSGRQKVALNTPLNPSESFLVDPTMNTLQTFGNYKLGGLGEKKQIGDFDVIRYVTQTDTKGVVKGFEELVYDHQTGKFLYALRRSGIGYNRKTGEMERYSDYFTLPDRSRFRGAYKAGVYVFSGNANLPSGRQRIGKVLNLTNDERFFLDANKVQDEIQGNILLGGFGERTRVGDFDVIRYVTQVDTKGVVKGFEELIFDLSGNFLYALKRSGMRYNRKTNELEGYTDNFTLPDRSRFRGAYKAGVYIFSGNANLPSGRQRIGKVLNLTKDERFLLDIEKNETERQGNIVLGGFGERTRVGDFDVIRYVTQADTKGVVKGFEELIFDLSGNFLYALKRTGMRYNRKTNELEGYTDNFTLPDKSSFRGLYKLGIYTFSGTAYLASGRQRVLKVLSLTKDERFFLDTSKTEDVQQGNIFIGGFGTLTVVGDFRIIRYYTQLLKGVLKGFEERVFDLDGKYLYHIKRSGIRTDRNTGDITAYSDKTTFKNRKSITNKWDLIKGLSATGTLETSKKIKLNFLGVPYIDRFLYSAVRNAFVTVLFGVSVITLNFYTTLGAFIEEVILN